jgi:glutamyl-tRNA synthetase
MLARGSAYRDYMTPEELEAERTNARAEGRVVRSPWRELSPNDAPDRPFVVRLRAPTDGETLIDDQVKGQVRFHNRDLDDLILLRTDGTPTYNLAVVVDDHEMGVTHVIRGDDHLNNAARQTLIYQGLGWVPPVWAHLPLIHGPDGAKLSKRHGAQAVGEFADMGYLPEAMRNYLARLGWGHGDDELFSDEQAAAWFDIKDVVSSPARLDWDKLKFINRHYIKLADDGRLLDLLNIADVAKARALAAIPLVKEGASTLIELNDLIAFALKHTDDLLDAKTAGLVADPDTHGRLSRLREQIAATEWNAPALEQAIRDFAASEQIGIGKFGPALRGLMGKGAPAPDLASTLMALGRDEALARWDYGLKAQ